MTTKLEPHCASKRRTRDKLAFTIPSTASVEMESEVAWEFNLQDAPPPLRREGMQEGESGAAFLKLGHRTGGTHAVRTSQDSTKQTREQII